MKRNKVRTLVGLILIFTAGTLFGMGIMNLLINFKNSDQDILTVDVLGMDREDIRDILGDNYDKEETERDHYRNVIIPEMGLGDCSVTAEYDSRYKVSALTIHYNTRNKEQTLSEITKKYQEQYKEVKIEKKTDEEYEESGGLQEERYYYFNEDKKKMICVSMPYDERNDYVQVRIFYTKDFDYGRDEVEKVLGTNLPS